MNKQPFKGLSFHLFSIVPAIFIFVGGWTGGVYGFSYEFHSEISGWATFEPDRDDEISIGLRFLPVFTFEHTIPQQINIDAEMSANAYGIARYETTEPGEYHGKLKPYRAWLRASTDQMEIRAGLQKINFGSAILLRPLMWFDQIDPRDPLQLTSGVYGLLGRYYLLNNTNIWLWGLYGNDDLKGWETDATDDDHPEMGGRVQLPFYTGEIALAYHYRKAMVDPVTPGSSNNQTESISENRIGIDGKWDLGVGVWFESVWIHQNTDALERPYRRLMTVGLDYTFDWGNGLNANAEHLVTATAKRPFDKGETSNISALSVSYSLGLIDTLSAIVNYDWEAQHWFRYGAWQRTYDDWNLFMMGFWNPSKFSPFIEDEERPEITGKGMRVMIVYNH